MSELTQDELRTLWLLSGNQHRDFPESILYGVFNLSHLATLERGSYLKRMRWGGERVSFQVTEAGRNALGGTYLPTWQEQITVLPVATTDASSDV